MLRISIACISDVLREYLIHVPAQQSIDYTRTYKRPELIFAKPRQLKNLYGANNFC